jgi:plasmid stabilization system protein ParE
MKYQVVILSRAANDVDTIRRWIAKQSIAGADRWYDEFLKATQLIAKDPFRYPEAVESTRLQTEVRQILFRTRRGNKYRVVFIVIGDEVRILRVRGQGQSPLRNNDLTN